MSEPLRTIPANAVSNTTNTPVQFVGAGQKRSHDALDYSNITGAFDRRSTFQYEWSCNVIRGKIQNLIDSGEVKVTHWLRDLGINSKSYGCFMKLKGTWNGVDNQTFDAAHAYFKQRQYTGIKEPKKNAKKRKSNDGSPSPPAAGTPDVSGIYLPGEDEDEVEVYDACDEMRRKIAAHLRKDDVTQAAFVRALSAQFHTINRKITASQLNAFRQKKGADSGNTSGIFYAAYVYFEKLRIKEGKAKSKHRLEMEEAWWDRGGFDVDRPGVSRTSFICRAGDRPYVNSLGQLVFSGPRGDRIMQPFASWWG